jgi:crotonobetainyl-CoA:carnitine CoA-transferase CaiB-like acyl-CoA transferase
MTVDGARVVSIAQNVPGPLAVARLRGAGASVTKVEPLAGDPFIELSPAWYAEMHEGIVVERLDLKSEHGHSRIAELLCDADLFVTSQRPSALARLGLDTSSLRPRCPRLRFLRIVGSVHEPERPGHDLTYQANAGLLGDTMPRSLFADVMASERAYAAAVQSFHLPPGSSTDVGLLESLEPLVAPIRHSLTTPGGILGGGAARYRVYRAKEGRVAVAALEPHFEARLYEAIGIAPGSDFDDCFLARTADDWESWARARDLPIVRVKQ